MTGETIIAPRSFNGASPVRARKVSRTATHRSSLYTLQWGLTREGEEGPAPSTSPIPSSSLQWGLTREGEEGAPSLERRPA